jgi:hypothetical protein
VPAYLSAYVVDACACWLVAGVFLSVRCPNAHGPAGGGICPARSGPATQRPVGRGVRARQPPVGNGGPGLPGEPARPRHGRQNRAAGPDCPAPLSALRQNSRPRRRWQALAPRWPDGPGPCTRSCCKASPTCTWCTCTAFAGAGQPGKGGAPNYGGNFLQHPPGALRIPPAGAGAHQPRGALRHHSGQQRPQRWPPADCAGGGPRLPFRQHRRLGGRAVRQCRAPQPRSGAQPLRRQNSAF